MAAPLNPTRSTTPAWPAATGEPAAPAAADVLPVAAPLRARGGRAGDVLGIAWLHGALHIAPLRRNSAGQCWAAPAPVATVEEFAAALDTALSALEFGGTEVVLILAHDEFVHQTEKAPSFSDKAARAYLRGRVERLEQEREPMMWVSQRANAARKEASYIVHLLPVAFYNRLNEVMLARRLDLTRILPLHVVLQSALVTLTETRDLPLLVAAEAGSATAVLVGRTGSDILFSRTILESWNKDATRVAVEVNRSLLFARQQFGATVDFVWLLGRGAESARTEVAAKCGAGTEITAKTAEPVEWLQIAVRLSERHPVNLVAPFTRRRIRRRFVRRMLVAACWLGLAWIGFDRWTGQQNWAAEVRRLSALRATEATLEAEHAQLERRNAQFAAQRDYLVAVVEARQPPVAEKFLAYLATILPREARLHELNVKWDAAVQRWEFQVSGVVEADAESAAAMVAAVRRELARSPLRARFVATVPGPVAIASGSPTSALQPFTLEGGLFED